MRFFNVFRFSLFVTIFFGLNFSYVKAQSVPKVPAVMYLGDLELNIKETARRQIQSDVDALHRHTGYFQRKVDQIDLYFPIIERIFRQENVPEEFKYLVIQESSLVADAVSTSNAVGFWQFKQETGLEVGLRIDNLVDERMNIVSSTHGAARYLKKNYFFFNNWIYSLMAYNTGAGGAERFIENKYRGAKKMDIDQGTHWYVKKFLAHKVAFEPFVGKNPNQNLFLFEYTDGSNQTLNQIASEFNLSSNAVADYNKWLKKGRIPDDKPYTVILPMPASEREMLARKYSPKETRESRSSETVVATETDHRRSSRYNSFQAMDESKKFPILKSHKITGNVTVNGIPGMVAKPNQKVQSALVESGLDERRFRKYNDMTYDDPMVEGQVYYFKSKKGKAGTHYHVMKPGETLWDVSQQYGVKMKKIISKNRMETELEARAGRVLWLRFIRPESIPVEYQKTEVAQAAPVKSSSPIQAKPDENLPVKTVEKPSNPKVIYTLEEIEEKDKNLTSTKESTRLQTDQNVKKEPITARNQESVPPMPLQSDKHIVQKGETLFFIARKYNLSVDDLRLWNQLNENDVLSPGQSLHLNNTQISHIIKTDGSPSEIIYIVQTEDTLYGIARKHNVSIKQILEWNNKEDFVIKPGERLKIITF
ncbi:MAG: LysM peptidoglycan-binding domain-containing protein [Cyclobacteriaceae bacterium]|nr:LysM peptidoglycan-binding domain-containing protein [Cyclobacteriaceae bacterium]